MVPLLHPEISPEEASLQSGEYFYTESQGLERALARALARETRATSTSISARDTRGTGGLTRGNSTSIIHGSQEGTACSRVIDEIDAIAPDRHMSSECAEAGSTIAGATGWDK